MKSRSDRSVTFLGSQGSRFKLAAAGIVTSSLALMMPAGAAHADDASTWAFKTTRSSVGKAVDVPGASSTQGVQLGIHVLNNTNAQKWKLVPQPNLGGYPVQGVGVERGVPYKIVLTPYKIVNAGNGLCMEAAGASPGEGSVVQQYRCDPNAQNQPNQIWYMYSAGTETFLINASSIPHTTKTVVHDGDISGKLTWKTVTETSVPGGTAYSYGTPNPVKVIAVNSAGKLILSESATYSPTQYFGLLKYDPTSSSTAPRECSMIQCMWGGAS